MGSDERNFRSSYYEKVGFRSVEEKKSLEILLKDKPLDRVKLTQFCLRFTVPSAYRILVWKILLGIVPVYTDSHLFVLHQRDEQYHDLLSALKVMQRVTVATPKPQLFVLMWYFEEGKLQFDWETQMESPMNKNLRAMSSALLKMFDSDVDVYWISKGLFRFVMKFSDGLPFLTACTKDLLEKEDPLLFKHFKDINGVDVLPLEKWFGSCFAEVLQELALVRIWDKLIGGSCKILAYVAIVLLTTLRRQLMGCKSPMSLLVCLSNISEETSELVATKSLELWHQNGCPLTPVSVTDTGKMPSPRPKSRHPSMEK